MRPNSDRWREVSDSEFAHERAGLDVVRGLLPDRAPYRAYSNFEFRDSQGRWHEVDLLVIGERRLHLVELKHYQGRIGGSGYRWVRGARTEDSPVLLARRKAQRLASIIKDGLRSAGYSGRAPYIQQAVFLHAENGRVDLPPQDLTDLYGLPGHENRSGLPSIEARLLEPAYDTDPLLAADDLLPALFDQIGFAVRREREIGSWRLVGSAIADGDGWQDWPAEHRADPSDTARVRIFTSPPGGSTAAIEGRAQLVTREFRLTKRLTHDGLLVPVDLVDHELGTGLVFRTEKDEQRLDLWLDQHADALGLQERLTLLRQVVEAVAYAHENHVVHRDLHPGAVVVTGTPDGRAPVRARVGDWQKAGKDEGTTTPGATRIFGAIARHHTEDDPGAAYRAPEARFSADADRIRLDVFGVGALAYLVVAGAPPAATSAELREKVTTGVGLDLAAALPNVPGAVRELVRRCTHPSVTSRPASMAEVLTLLSDAEQAVHRGTADVDPLDANPGDVIGDRFRVVQRLGKGSTAVGLLVEDGAGTTRVLKVALDDRAGARLRDEAEVLTSLAPARSPRLVRLAEPEPVELGGRTVLVLEPAGEQTLADVLRQRRRLSIDLLERYGSDLCQALVALDTAGIDHRDIKPANLGVREQPGDRTKHLVLFDFSLARAGADAVQAGTPPYLDPFLGTGTRRTWDSAAERYAAAVTLYEMATGRLPVYGDGASDPAVIRDEATLRAEDFDPSLAEPLLTFFRRALARHARVRHDTAESMQVAWRSVFTSPTATTVPDDPRDAIERARPETPLAQAGLTARALSALEPLTVRTVADLVAVPAGSLSNLRGAAVSTRDEIRTTAKLWRARFGATAVEPPGTTTTGPAPDAAPSPAEVSNEPFADPRAAVGLLLAAVGSGAPARRVTVATLLGAGADGRDVSAFGTLGEIALAARGAAGSGDVTEVANHLRKAHETWTTQEQTRNLLGSAGRKVCETVTAMGGVVDAESLAARLTSGDDTPSRRAAEALLRVVLDHGTDAVGDDLVFRRWHAEHGASRLVVASDTRLLDAGPALAATAARMVADARRDGRSLVPASLAAAEVARTWPDGVTRPGDDVTLVQCAARLDGTVAASSRGELHSRGLSPKEAVRAALGGVALDQALSRDDVAAMVRSRFPTVEAVPDGDRLDQLVLQADVGLRWDGTAYRSATLQASATSLVPRPPTIVAAAEPVDRRADEEPFLRSRTSASFLAVMAEPLRLDETADALAARYGAATVDVVQLLIDALRAAAAEKGVPWQSVTAADAAAPGSTPARGLAALVAQAVPQVVDRVTELAATEPAGQQPVLVSGAGILARYGHAQVVARWADINAHRNQAVWLLVPEVDGSASLDGQPIGLNYASQLVRAPRSLLAVNA